MNAKGRDQARLEGRSSAFMRDPRSGSPIEASPSGKARLAQSLPLRQRCPRSGRCRKPGRREACFRRHPGLRHQRQRSGRSVEASPPRESAPRAIPPFITSNPSALAKKKGHQFGSPASEPSFRLFHRIADVRYPLRSIRLLSRVGDVLLHRRKAQM